MKKVANMKMALLCACSLFMICLSGCSSNEEEYKLDIPDWEPAYEMLYGQWQLYEYSRSYGNVYYNNDGPILTFNKDKTILDSSKPDQIRGYGIFQICQHKQDTLICRVYYKDLGGGVGDYYYLRGDTLIISPALDSAAGLPIFFLKRHKNELTEDSE